MATTTRTEELEFSSKDDNRKLSNELYAELVEAIRALNKGDKLNALKTMLAISRSLG